MEKNESSIYMQSIMHDQDDQLLYIFITHYFVLQWQQAKSE